MYGEREKETRKLFMAIVVSPYLKICSKSIAIKTPDLLFSYAMVIDILV